MMQRVETWTIAGKRSRTYAIETYEGRFYIRASEEKLMQEGGYFATLLAARLHICAMETYVAMKTYYDGEKKPELKKRTYHVEKP